MNKYMKLVNNLAEDNLVTNAGANLIQGYYFSKPLPRLEFVEFVKNFKNKNE